ncbi:MAG: cupin domain-containing protein [Nitrososphaeria archaeon]|jgi:Uncharacterized conserved protein, contains double-stranded beta-helix domain
MEGIEVGHVDDVEYAVPPAPGSRSSLNQWLMSRERGSPDFFVRRFLIGPGGRIAMHVHDFYGFIYVVRGTCTICGRDGKAEVGPGGFALVRAGVEHEFLNAGGEEMEAICVNSYADDMGITAVEPGCSVDRDPPSR